jgi:hypothetical protein
VRKPILTILALAVGVSGCATNFVLTPQPTGSQTIEYAQGTPTTFSEGEHGAVQVTPIGTTEDHRLIFGVAAFNKGDKPANFGVENLALATTAGGPVKIYTTEELIAEAKRRAMWQAVAVAFAGAAAAYAANANAYHTTYGTAYTPHGTYSFYSRTYDPGLAYVGTAAAGAATGYGLVQIKNSLSQTINGLRGHSLQTTTVGPGDSYGGEVMTDHPEGRSFPQQIELTVHWNGDDHVFQFSVAKTQG